MKKFKFILLAVLLLTSLGACKKEYMETTATDKVEFASVFTTTANADAALSGIYRYLFNRYSDQNQPGVGGILLAVDYMGDDLHVHQATWFNSEASWISPRTDNSAWTSYHYRFFYRVIGNANYILANIDNTVGPATTKNRIKAEALTLRAWAYSYLVQFYGKRYDASTTNTQLGVPLMLLPTDANKPRATVQQVYQQINADLDAAIALNITSAPNKSHINVWVTRAIKARVALTMQDYPTAITQAKLVIDGGLYPLMSVTDYQTGFNNAALSEFMWASMPTTDQADTFGSFFAQISYDANTTHVRGTPKRINQALYTWIPATDVRKKMWEPAPTTANFPLPSASYSRQTYMSRKFAQKPATTSMGDVPLVRSAEMHLILAEAYARNSQTAFAQDALFALVTKRDPSAVKSVNTGSALITEILNHRRVELWGEGFRWLDLKRMNLPLDRTLALNFLATPVANLMQVPAGDDRWQFFIPRAEIEANKGMVGQQNP